MTSSAAAASNNIGASLGGEGSAEPPSPIGKGTRRRGSVRFALAEDDATAKKDGPKSSRRMSVPCGSNPPVSPPLLAALPAAAHQAGPSSAAAPPSRQQRQQKPGASLPYGRRTAAPVSGGDPLTSHSRPSTAHPTSRESLTSDTQYDSAAAAEGSGLESYFVDEAEGEEGEEGQVRRQSEGADTFPPPLYLPRLASSMPSNVATFGVPEASNIQDGRYILPMQRQPGMEFDGSTRAAGAAVSMVNPAFGSPTINPAFHTTPSLLADAQPSPFDGGGSWRLSSRHLLPRSGLPTVTGRAFDFAAIDAGVAAAAAAAASVDPRLGGHEAYATAARSIHAAMATTATPPEPDAGSSGGLASTGEAPSSSAWGRGLARVLRTLGSGPRSPGGSQSPLLTGTRAGGLSTSGRGELISPRAHQPRSQLLLPGQAKQPRPGRGTWHGSTEESPHFHESRTSPSGEDGGRFTASSSSKGNEARAPGTSVTPSGRPSPTTGQQARTPATLMVRLDGALQRMTSRGRSSMIARGSRTNPSSRANSGLIPSLVAEHDLQRTESVSWVRRLGEVQDAIVVGGGSDDSGEEGEERLARAAAAIQPSVVKRAFPPL